MGHATRSKVVIQHLLDSGHSVRVATSDRAFELLEKAFPGCCFRIEGLHLKYERGTVDKSASFANLMANAPESLATNVQQYIRLWKEELPDAVISDFESFTYYFAKLRKIPLLSIDNMQVINRCHLGFDIPPNESDSYQLAKAIIKAKVPFCERYLITSFFEAETRKPNTFLVPPILRDIVIRTKALDLPVKDHILVYQTASSQDDLVDGLRSVRDLKFIVYGLNRDETLDNVTLRTFSEDGFIQELATSCGVITNGGFSLISEAVFLHRPVCSFPIAGQFEQFVNGAQVEQCGYGRRFSQFSADAVKAFLYDLPRFAERLRNYHQLDNSVTFSAVEQFLNDVQMGPIAEEA